MTAQLFTLTPGSVASPVRWRIDAARSTIEFRVATFKLGTVRGRFEQIDGTIELAPGAARPTATGSIRVASLGSGNARRDRHLKSVDYLDADRHPAIGFETGDADPLADPERVPVELTIRASRAPSS